MLAFPDVFVLAAKFYQTGAIAGDILHESQKERTPLVMALPVVEFLREGYKIRKIFALESTYPKEIIDLQVLD